MWRAPLTEAGTGSREASDSSCSSKAIVSPRETRHTDGTLMTRVAQTVECVFKSDCSRLLSAVLRSLVLTSSSAASSLQPCSRSKTKRGMDGLKLERLSFKFVICWEIVSKDNLRQLSVFFLFFFSIVTEHRGGQIWQPAFLVLLWDVLFVKSERK